MPAEPEYRCQYCKAALAEDEDCANESCVTLNAIAPKSQAEIYRERMEAAVNLIKTDEDEALARGKEIVKELAGMRDDPIQQEYYKAIMPIIGAFTPLLQARGEMIAP